MHPGGEWEDDLQFSWIKSLNDFVNAYTLFFCYSKWIFWGWTSPLLHNALILDQEREFQILRIFSLCDRSATKLWQCRAFYHPGFCKAQKWSLFSHVMNILSVSVSVADGADGAVCVCRWGGGGIYGVLNWKWKFIRALAKTSPLPSQDNENSVARSKMWPLQNWNRTEVARWITLRTSQVNSGYQCLFDSLTFCNHQGQKAISAST